MDSAFLIVRSCTVQRRRSFASFVIGLVLLAACACAPSAPPPSPPNNTAMAIEHLRAPDAETWLEKHGADLARSLPATEAERVAAVAIAHPSLQVRVFGIALLFERVGEQQGAAAAAERVIKGDDLLGVIWGWMHLGSPEVADRRLALIRKEVQSRLPSLAGDERRRAEQLLCTQQSGC